MRKRGLAVLAVVLFAGLSAPARGQGEFPLKKRAIGGSPPPAAVYARQFVQGERDRPPALKGAPEVSRNAFYFSGSFGGKQVLMLCDFGPQPKLYVDSDQDGDLSDETAFTSKKKPVRRSLAQILTGTGGSAGSSEEVTFGPISLVLSDLGTTVDFTAEVPHRSSDYAYMLVQPASYLSGEVQLAGKSYEVNLVDATFDGRYDARFSAAKAFDSDWIAVDLDRNGVMQQTMSGPSEVIPLPRMIRAGEAYYGIEVLPDGSAIRVETVQPEFGTVDMEGKGVHLTLWSDSGCHALASAQGSVQLPAGSYRAMEIVLGRKDEKGASWRLRSYGNTGKLTDFQVQAGQTLALTVGEPLRGNVTFNAQPGLAYLGFSLAGQAGEEYAAGADRGGRRQKAPKFKILSESDKVLVSGSFEYG